MAKTAKTEVTQKIACDCKCLHDLGYIEVELADGTKCQMTVEQAQAKLAEMENTKKALKGII